MSDEFGNAQRHDLSNSRCLTKAAMARRDRSNRSRLPLLFFKHFHQEHFGVTEAMRATFDAIGGYILTEAVRATLNFHALTCCHGRNLSLCGKPTIEQADMFLLGTIWEQIVEHALL